MGNGVSVQSHLAGDEVQSLFAALVSITPISLHDESAKNSKHSDELTDTQTADRQTDRQTRQ